MLLLLLLLLLQPVTTSGSGGWLRHTQRHRPATNARLRTILCCFVLRRCRRLVHGVEKMNLQGMICGTYDATHMSSARLGDLAGNHQATCP